MYASMGTGAIFVRIVVLLRTACMEGRAPDVRIAKELEYASIIVVDPSA